MCKTGIKPIMLNMLGGEKIILKHLVTSTGEHVLLPHSLGHLGNSICTVAQKNIGNLYDTY